MWTKEALKLLFSLYGKHEHLYNVNHPDYLNRVKRSDTMLEICERLQELEPRITVQGIKTKIHTLRSQYTKEVKLLKASEDNGDCGEDLYVPKVWWFSLMDYMRPYLNINTPLPNPSYSNRKMHSIKVKRERIESLSDFAEDDSSDETQQSFSSRGSTLSPTNIPAKQRKLPFGLKENFDKVRSLLLKKVNEESEYKWIAHQVEFEFSKIKDDNIKRETAWKIQDVLRDASIKDRPLKHRVNKR